MYVVVIGVCWGWDGMGWRMEGDWELEKEKGREEEGREEKEDKGDEERGITGEVLLPIPTIPHYSHSQTYQTTT